MTRRIVLWATGIVAALIALPVLAIAICLVVANTDPGRRLIETETAKLTGGMVVIRDLTGRFPDALRIGEIQVSDAKGRYVTINGLVLDWSPLQLLRRTARIDQLSAMRIELSRLPEFEPHNQQQRHIHPAGAGRFAASPRRPDGDRRTRDGRRRHIDIGRFGRIAEPDRGSASSGRSAAGNPGSLCRRRHHRGRPHTGDGKSG